MSEVKTPRLYLLRGLYLLITLGLALSVWPEIISPDQRLTNQDTVIESLLGGMALLTAFGVRYPLKMLPILIFELVWKLIWILGYAIPVWMNDGLNTYGAETFFACLIGVILVPLAIPWRYVYRHYILAKPAH